jgi:hypothetical protein
VLDREEIDPSPGGDLVLVCAETAAKVEVSLDERAVRAYRKRLETFVDQLAAYAKQRGLFYQRVAANAATEDALPWNDALVAYLRAG